MGNTISTEQFAVSPEALSSDHRHPNCLGLYAKVQSEPDPKLGKQSLWEVGLHFR